MINRISVISDLPRITSYLQLDSDNLRIPLVVDPNIELGDMAPVLVQKKENTSSSIGLASTASRTSGRKVREIKITHRIIKE